MSNLKIEIERQTVGENGQNTPIRLIKPFTIGEEKEESQKTEEKTSQLIRPLTFEQEEKADRNLPMTNQAPVKEEPAEIKGFNLPHISPFLKLSDQSIKKAKYIMENLNLPEQDKKTLERYVAKGIEENPGVMANISAIAATVPYFSATKDMNFSLRLRRIKIYFYDTEDGEMKKRFYLIQIKVVKKNGKIQVFETEVEDNKIKSTEWLKKATGCLAKIPSDKREKQVFTEMIQSCIETENVTTEIQYPNAGWRNIPLMGWKYVFGNGVVGERRVCVHTDTTYSLNIKDEALGTKGTFDKALEMTSICQNRGVSHTLWLYVHAAMLTTLFELAGYPLNFVFIIQGITNSRKTSLVTTVAKLFDRDRLVADAEFATATACGIEKTASRYKDAPVLIDDLKPGATMAQQREMDRKLDELIRLYGNRVSKKRMTDFMPRGKEKFFPVGGGCILTAEVLNGVSSTLTRTFTVEINNMDVRNEVLSFYQIQRWILPTYAYDFLAWVTEGFQGIVNFIREHFPEWRKTLKFHYARYAEIYATFWCIGILISQYAQDRGFWGRDEAGQFVTETQQYVQAILLNNQEKIEEKNKGKLAIQAFGKALETAEIAPVELNEQTCQQRKDLYEDRSRYYIRSQILKRLVDQYSSKWCTEKKIFSNEELLMLLENLNVLEIEENAGKRIRSRKLPIQKGNSLRYLYLNKESVRNILAE